MTQIGMYEARTKLSQLVERAAAGEDIVIARNGRPVARLVSITASSSKLADVYGTLRDQIHFHEDVNDLPDDVTDAFGER